MANRTFKPQIPHQQMQQPTLFDLPQFTAQSPESHRAQAQADLMVLAQVLVPAPLGPLSYKVPQDWVSLLQPGCKVWVPLRRRKVAGYLLRSESFAHANMSPSGRTRRLLSILRVEHQAPKLPSDLLQTILFAAQYYHVPAGLVLKQAVPANLSQTTKRYICRLESLPSDLIPLEHAICRILQRRPNSLHTLSKHLHETKETLSWHLTRLCSQQRIEIVEGKVAKPSTSPSQGAPGKQVRAQEPQPQALPAKSASNPWPSHPPNLLHVPATQDQQRANQTLKTALQHNQFQPFLLEGVTGSGKTQVYLQAIASALAQDKQALLLVPEIALTGPLVACCQQAFQQQVVVLHSDLTPGQRQAAWQAMANGRAHIGIGARSALFLPAQRLGLIIVDEEHETSYKQDTSPCYNGRDLALVRGQACQAVVLLGSATPSLESYQSASQGKYTPLMLPHRIHQRPMPQVEILSLIEHPGLQGTLLSAPLIQRMEDCLAHQEQIILYLNRRGYAPVMQCQSCGQGLTCPHCAIHLTLYQQQRRLRCHYCNYEIFEPSACQHCQSTLLICSGVGLEQVEEQLKKLFPQHTALRLDSDNASTHQRTQTLLQRFARKEASILLGTQMITKGHHFPQVTLVGVLAADASLHFPDFRAAERTFQTLTQVGGRAGRGEHPGRVVLQTMQPDHYAITTAAHHDIAGFRAIEMPLRQELHYPPFTHLALLCCTGPHEQQVSAAAQEMGAQLNFWAKNQAHQGYLHILGPTPAPYVRLQGKWRYHLLIKAKQRSTLHRLIDWGQTRAPNTSAVQYHWDIDPFQLL